MTPSTVGEKTVAIILGLQSSSCGVLTKKKEQRAYSSCSYFHLARGSAVGTVWAREGNLAPRRNDFDDDSGNLILFHIYYLYVLKEFSLHSHHPARQTTPRLRRFLVLLLAKAIKQAPAPGDSADFLISSKKWSAALRAIS